MLDVLIRLGIYRRTTSVSCIYALFLQSFSGIGQVGWRCIQRRIAWKVSGLWGMVDDQRSISIWRVIRNDLNPYSSMQGNLFMTLDSQSERIEAYQFQVTRVQERYILFTHRSGPNPERD